jgi:hypothetical protein
VYVNHAVGVLRAGCRGGVQPFSPATGSSQLPAPAGSAAGAGGWYTRFVPDEQDRLDDRVLAQDPAGDCLVQARTPWLVSDRRGGGGGGGGLYVVRC